MKILIYIGGGMSFFTYDEYLSWLQSEYIEGSSVPYSLERQQKWKIELVKKWIEKGGVVYFPEMPNKYNARYSEWKIVFEGVLSKIAPDDEVTFVGHSLGGNFLLKYFSDLDICHSEERRICPEDLLKDNEQMLPIVSMTKQDMRLSQIHLVAACISAGNFTPPENYDTLKSLGSKVHIWHEEDDRVVPFAIAKFLEKALPEAQTHFFGPERGYGHFSPLEVFEELESVLFDEKKIPLL